MRIPTRRKREAILPPYTALPLSSIQTEDTTMKTRALLAAFAVALLAACAESPTGPDVDVRLGTSTIGSGL